MNPVEIVQFIGIPVVVATVIMFLSWGLLRSTRLQPLGATFAVGISSLVAFVLQEGIPAIPPSQKWHWLVMTAIIVSVLACIYPLLKQFDKLIVLQALITGVIAAIFMQFPNQEDWLLRLGIGFSVLFVSVGLRRLTIPPWHMYIASWWVLAGYSFLALQASFAKLAFFAGAMSAVAAALCVLQLLKKRDTKSVQMIFGVFIVGSAMCGLAYDPSHNVPPLAWFLPMIGIPISAIAYFLCKYKYPAFLSLAIIDSFVFAAVIWSIMAAPAGDELWP